MKITIKYHRRSVCIHIVFNQGDSYETMKKAAHPPGGILKRNYIDQSVVTLSQLADIPGLSEEAASEVVNGRARVTADMALRVSRAFGTSPLSCSYHSNMDRTSSAVRLGICRLRQMTVQ